MVDNFHKNSSTNEKNFKKFLEKVLAWEKILDEFLEEFLNLEKDLEKFWTKKIEKILKK